MKGEAALEDRADQEPPGATLPDPIEARSFPRRTLLHSKVCTATYFYLDSEIGCS